MVDLARSRALFPVTLICLLGCTPRQCPAEFMMRDGLCLERGPAADAGTEGRDGRVETDAGLVDSAMPPIDAGPCPAPSGNPPTDIFETDYDALASPSPIPTGSAPGAWFVDFNGGTVTDELGLPCMRNWARHPAPDPGTTNAAWGVDGEGFFIPADRDVWFRTRVYLPAGFDADTSAGFLKFMRLNMTNDSRGGFGRHDLVIDASDLSLRFITERVDEWTNTGARLTRGTPHTVELFVRPDLVPVDAGGRGRVRLWLDGALIADITAHPTSLSGVTGFDQIQIFSYWNGADGESPGVPASAYPPASGLVAYTRDEQLRSSAAPPTNRDADGNLFIGL